MNVIIGIMSRARPRQNGYTVFTMVIFALFAFGAAAGMVITSTRLGIASTLQYNAATTIVAQANLIRGKLLDCALQAGNNGSGNHPTYPSGTATSISALTCPVTGSPNVVTGTDGVFLPPAPSGFNGWVYTNDATNVRIQLKATSLANATGYNSALNTAVSQLGSAASIVTLTNANDTLQLVVTN